MNDLYKSFGDEYIILIYALMFGFVQVMRTYLCRKNNLNFMARLIIIPIIYYFIAKVIFNITPHNLKPLLTIMLGVLVIYYAMFNKLCIYDDIEFNIKNVRQYDTVNNGSNRKLKIEEGTIEFKKDGTQIPITNINIV